MADSNITKRALATALKELMEDVPFSKISVSDICEKCAMNRKSFYYHFRDKYDLVNWIFYMECLLPLHEYTYDSVGEVLLAICQHLYENREFYRKAFKITGQNSFSEYFREMLEPLLVKMTDGLFAEEADRNFYMTFYAGTSIQAIEHWIQEKDCIPAGEFIGKTKACLLCIASKILEIYS